MTKVIRSDGENRVVLLDPGLGDRPIKNLVKFDRAGQVLWEAELPTSGGGECYVGASAINPSEIVAISWSGYRVTIDTEGKISHREFVK